MFESALRKPIAVGLRTFNTLDDDTPILIQSGAMLALIIPVLVFLFAQRCSSRGSTSPACRNR